MRTTIPTLLTLCALIACSGAEPTVTPEPSGEVAADPAADKTAKIAAIAIEIKASPDDYEAILSKHGMTSVEFEAALYDIASDPALSARYTAEVH